MASELDSINEFEMNAAEQEAFVKALSAGIGDATRAAKQKVLESRTEARQAALLETGNGVRQLLSEHKRPPGGGAPVNTWWREHEALQARAQKLDELQAAENEIARLDRKGDQGSDHRKRVSAEVVKLKGILGR